MADWHPLSSRRWLDRIGNLDLFAHRTSERNSTSESDPCFLREVRRVVLQDWFRPFFSGPARQCGPVDCDARARKISRCEAATEVGCLGVGARHRSVPSALRDWLYL